MLKKTERERVWFDRWIQEGYSVRQLCLQSKHRTTKLYDIISYWLQQLPVNTKNLSGHEHIIFDGSFLKKRIGIVVAMDGTSYTVIDGQYGIKENSIPQLKTFFEPLIIRGLYPKSATVDGNPQVIRVMRSLWPEIKIQRCLVHIQRQGLMWCRHRPKRTDARHLRKILLKVTYIKTKKERDNFLSAVEAWEHRYGSSLASAPERGRVFSDIKRARSMIINAIPDMFHYLDDLNIPSTTNGLEGYFSRLKMKYRQHRGLTKQKRSAYFKWYFHLCKR